MAFHLFTFLLTFTLRHIFFTPCIFSSNLHRLNIGGPRSYSSILFSPFSLTCCIGNLLRHLLEQCPPEALRASTLTSTRRSRRSTGTTTISKFSGGKSDVLHGCCHIRDKDGSIFSCFFALAFLPSNILFYICRKVFFFFLRIW